MFGRMLHMDCKRCFELKKFIPITSIVLLLIFACGAQSLVWAWNYRGQYTYDVVSILTEDVLLFDRYKIVMAFVLGALYTSSVCSDDNNYYLRMILSRVDITTYIQSRLLANTIVIIASCIAAFFLFAVLTSPLLALYEPDSHVGTPYYYIDVLAFSPVIYMLMMGLQFGIIVAACSSIGILFSAYQSNAFVSVGLVGLILFCVLSYIPMESIFGVVLSSGMAGNPALSNFSPMVNYMWGILYPILVIVLSGYLFYRRMKWRMQNGYI